ncbi:MAG: penicillin-insensitive murein endopeptidase [Flavobacteriales bacterium]|jgi:penicillin-insensitive murein endopeptidase|nr:penicillin-insensitive murein endopeptidase [Flavobacteriales bacterium]
MKLLLYFIPVFLFYACQSQEAPNKQGIKSPSKPLGTEKDTAILSYYQQNKGNKKPSRSSGSVSNGKLTNGKLLPFYGTNFSYFDKGSYLSGRAYLNNKVLTTVLESYKQLEKEVPNRHFFIMETANQKGGELYPHRTHQTGLSVDFMMPLIQNKQPYYKLDSLGTRHYLLAFNDQGEYANDNTVKVDFNLIARHILILNQQAKKVGLKIKKVIIKIEYKDELFATEYGKKLKASGIYVVKGLSKMINALHDEHYHIDFGEG